MPFIDADGGTPRWVSERDTIWLQDPLRRAGETLARDVETFLYDSHDPKHRDVGFLMWAVARFDVAKTGSGRYADTVDYDPAEAMKDPHGPNPSGTETPNRVSEIDIRFPAHAREVLADDFGPNDKTPEEPHFARPDAPSGVFDGRSERPADAPHDEPLQFDAPHDEPVDGQSPDDPFGDEDGEE
jgi:hypothetical protein